MAATDTFPLVDRIMGGGLVDFLTAASAEGESAERIAKRLFSEHDIDVSAETVRRWTLRCGAEA